MSFTSEDITHLKEILSRNRSVGPRVVEALLDQLKLADAVRNAAARLLSQKILWEKLGQHYDDLKEAVKNYDESKRPSV